MQWPSADEMFDPTVLLDIKYSDAPIRVFKERVNPILQKDRKSKFIYYTNNKSTLEQNIETALLAHDLDPLIKADLVPLTGDYIKEQKLWHVVQFCKSNQSTLDELETCDEDKRPFNPKEMFATSGVANAGIDCADVIGTCRAKFMPSKNDGKQESGRAG